LVISKKSSTFAADFETQKIEKSLTQKTTSYEKVYLPVGHNDDGGIESVL
jgi:hypothetical protein